jgi:NAD(P)-dependent dehydrogenase (short-subunit alcohol dehydrogenase family)
VTKGENVPGRLDGRTAILTGGGKGIGLAETRLLAQEGARVVIADTGRQDGRARADLAAAELRADGHEAIGFAEDISTFSAAESLVAAALNEFGRVDILINNATRRAPGPLDEITEHGFDSVLESNLKATISTIRAVTPTFRRQGSGVVVNTGSESGLGQPYNAVYAAAKEAVTGLTRSVARELGRYGVRCNQVRPRAGGTQPAAFWATFEEHARHIEDLGPLSMGRVGLYAASQQRSAPVAPEFVAPFVVWLCTDAAAEVNGRDFVCYADEVTLLTEPGPVRSAVHVGGWSLDTLDELAGGTIAAGLVNEFNVGAETEATR